MLAVTALLAADTLGLLPDDTQTKVGARAALCESVAVNCSIMAGNADRRGIQASLEALVERNPDVLSAALRRADGRIAVEINEHTPHWKLAEGSRSTSSQMFVPIFRGKQKWGEIEVRFAELKGSGWMSMLQSPLTKLIVFFAASCYLAFFFYLRRMLQQLDPSKVIPDRVRAALDALAEGLVVVDQSEHIVLANAAFARRVASKPDKLQAHLLSHFPWRLEDETAGQKNPSALPWNRAIAEGRPLLGETLRLRTEEGEELVFLVNATPVMGEGNASRGALVSFEDVTPLKKKQAELIQMLDMLKDSREQIRRQNDELQILATQDPLTGCLNRRSFFEKFESRFSEAQSGRFEISVVMVDIDHFKAFNDTHGHAFGDTVLKEVAGVLKSSIADDQVLCRFGGEEFCVLLPGKAIEPARAAAESFRAAIEAHQVDGLAVTASLGTSSLALGAASAEELLEQADKCLYVSKRNGRNRVTGWDEVPDDLEVDESKVSRSGDAPNKAAATSLPAESVAALVSALNFRDSMTADHSRRVAHLVAETATGLISVAEVRTVEVAALLHDIGKIAVPDAILLKPGPLDDEEWEVMKAHSRIGVEMVRTSFNCDPLTEILEAASAWYGGNPSNPGLPTGDAIPLGARIIAIADAYDSMTSEQVYRQSLTQTEAFNELRRCAGLQFDPQLVDRFICKIHALDHQLARPEAALSEQVSLHIGEQIERLAAALSRHDLEALEALTGHLKSTARKYGVGDVADAAEKLEQSLKVEPELSALIADTNQVVKSFQLARQAVAQAL